MATYIVLVDYTEQGIRSIKDSPGRTDGLTEMAGRHGATIRNLFWTSGEHDGVIVIDAPDDAAVSKLMLSVARLGNVRTRTLRAYERSEMESILGDVD